GEDARLPETARRRLLDGRRGGHAAQPDVSQRARAQGRRQDDPLDPPRPRPHRRRSRGAVRRRSRAPHGRPLFQRPLSEHRPRGGWIDRGMGGDDRPRARARLRPRDPGPRTRHRPRGPTRVPDLHARAGRGRRAGGAQRVVARRYRARGQALRRRGLRGDVDPIRDEARPRVRGAPRLGGGHGERGADRRARAGARARTDSDRDGAPEGDGGAAVKDLFSIEGKVALVTGGSRGIGLMIARGYAEPGARVYVASRGADACAEAAAELSKVGTCTALPADLSRHAEVKRLAGELAAREPALHILVNNAGANWGAPIEEYPDAAWDKVLALN